MVAPRTFPEAFQQTVAAWPDRVALRDAESGESWTWERYATEVERIAGGLAGLGLRHGDTFAAMLANRPEFNLTETAASHLGATTFSIYNTSSVEQVRYLLEHADARVMVTERQFVEQIRAAGGQVEHLLVVEDGDVDALRPQTGFDFGGGWRAVTPEDVLCLIYTSGTTGPPKGVEHTHRGGLAMAEAVGAFYPASSSDSMLSYLPSAHAADRFFTHYFGMLAGFETISLGDARRLAAVLPEVRPTLFAAVPRIWERIKLGVEQRLGADPTLQAAFEAGNEQVAGGIRAALGLDRLRWALSGAAAIPPEHFAFLQRLGIPVSEMWGMSECGMGTGAPPEQARQGTVGFAPPGVELRFAEDGELLLRAPSLMRGYRNEPEQTAAAIDADGWLHSGDVATVDAEGYVRIVDRKKELIIGAGGKNLSPSNIEFAVSAQSPLVGSVVAIGDGRPYVVALITLDPEAAAAFAAAAGVTNDPAVLAKDERVRQIVQASVDAGNARLARVEQVKRFAILPAYWEPGGDEMTPTMKIKRQPVATKYAAVIDELYARS